LRIVRKLNNIASPLISNFVGRAIITEGNLKGSKEPFRFLFVGDHSFRTYLSEHAYQEPPAVIKNEIILFSKLHNLIEREKKHLDMALVCLPKKFMHLCESYSHFRSVHNVGQIIDISGSWEDVKKKFKKSRKNFANQVGKKYDLTFRVSNNIHDFNLFYHKMYLPYINKKFSQINLKLDLYKEMKKFFDIGFLVLIVHKNKDIAGALCIPEDRSLMFRRVGIMDADEQYNRLDAQMALYYFCIVIAREKGLSFMDTMISEPFLSDSIYQSKWMWGASVYHCNELSTTPYYFILNYSGKIVDFFQNNPAIIQTVQGLAGLIGWQGERDLTIANKKKLTKTYYAPGLDSMLLLTHDSDEAIEFRFPNDMRFSNHIDNI